MASISLQDIYVGCGFPSPYLLFHPTAGGQNVIDEGALVAGDAAVIFCQGNPPQRAQNALQGVLQDPKYKQQRPLYKLPGSRGALRHLTSKDCPSSPQVTKMNSFLRGDPNWQLATTDSAKSIERSCCQAFSHCIFDRRGCSFPQGRP